MDEEKTYIEMLYQRMTNCSSCDKELPQFMIDYPTWTCAECSEARNNSNRFTWVDLGPW